MASIFGNYTERNRDRVSSYVQKVNSLESEFKNITNDQSLVTIKLYGKAMRVTREKAAFMAYTFMFRKRLRNGESLESILPEALALCREATRRKLGLFQYDVQVEAAVAMLGNVLGKNEEGQTIRENIIAEMKTGEGKTLVQLLIGYLTALEATKDADPSKWKSIHIMTSNDALAKRDKESNGKVFDLLGFSCGFVPSRRSMSGKSPQERNIYKKQKKDAYASDIVFSTATNIAFDYLDDNTVLDPKEINIRRPFGYAIIDEADDLLIDQAINPLKISGKPRGLSPEYLEYLKMKDEEKLRIYEWAANFLLDNKGEGLKISYKKFAQRNDSLGETFKEEFAYIEDTQEVVFSNRLYKKIYEGVTEDIGALRVAAVQDCIKAFFTYRKGKYYQLVRESNGKYRVVLVDQNTGRYKHGSKYNDGLQEAIEAIETYRGRVSFSPYGINKTVASETLAMCTYPDFLSLYEGGVCGMTGTSDPEEFGSLYGFSTYEVKTRRPNIRVDETNEVYATKGHKYAAILKKVEEAHKRGQPVLIGTSSVMESNELSFLLNRARIPHQLLNATNEGSENIVIAGAGQKGMVTIATNMAGRGVDIKLGPGVKELGGLYVIGTTRNKSLRIDSQLRGRAGRQGDPGKSKYFSSLDDELVQLYINTSSLKKLFNKESGMIRNSKIIKLVSKALKKRDEQDKLTRSTFEKLNIVYSKHKNHIYKMRKNVLYYEPTTILKNIKLIMEEYAEFLVYNKEVPEIKSLIGHLVNVEECYNSNKNTFSKNLADAMFEKLRSSVPKTIEEAKTYFNEIRIKFLHVIDVYWHEHMRALEDIKSNVANNCAVDTLKEYELQADRAFGKDLIPYIYNEMITYACNPDMKFGEYEPSSHNSSLEEPTMSSKLRRYEVFLD